MRRALKSGILARSCQGLGGQGFSRWGRELTSEVCARSFSGSIILDSPDLEQSIEGWDVQGSCAEARSR